MMNRFVQTNDGVDHGKSLDAVLEKATHDIDALKHPCGHV
jgi:hypothetical protein